MGISRSIPEQSTSEKAVCFCLIDYQHLCDKNDFSMLTANYNIIATQSLAKTIHDEKLRTYVLEAIRCESRIKKLGDNYENYDEQLSIMQHQSDVQKECREYYSKTYDSPNYSETTYSTDVEEQVKQLNARQRCILAYYIAVDNKVYFDEKDNNVTQKAIKEILVTIFGGSQSSYSNLIVPDFNNATTRKDMAIVAKTIKLIFPRIANDIMMELDNLEKES